MYLNIWLNQGEIPEGLKSKLVDTDADGRITFYDLNDAANALLVADKNGNGYIDAQDLLNDLQWGDGLDTDKNGFVDDLFGWNFRAASDESFAPNDPRDVLGHGTHVAGTIGAIGNNGRGVSGINWRSSLMALKFLDSSNQGLISDAVLAVNYATMMRTEHGENVRVLNASWGQSGGYSAALRTAITTAGDAGLLFVAAAGNGNILGQGIDIDAEPFFPASYDLDNILTVAATGSHDELARFSNYGGTAVDLAAPGVGVLSTLPGGRYGTSNGTSMAAPHVAGVAALVWAEVPDATLAEVRQALLGSAEPLPELLRRTVVGGRLNARRALDSNAFAPRAHLVSAANITTAGGTENLITVRYIDRHGIDVATLDSADLVVARQWGAQESFSVTLMPESLVVSPDGHETTATYRLAAPDGTWDALDYGRYVVSMLQEQVRNVYGLSVPPSGFGEFSVWIADASVLYVDTLEDAVDANVGDGVCAAASGVCTLRAAIQEANAATPATRTIVLDSGTYRLSLPPVPDIAMPFPTTVPGGSTPTSSPPWSNEASGDLDVMGDITIVGDEARTSTIDAGGLDRVFKVHPGARLVLRRTGVTGGASPGGQDGGGILTAGTLQLDTSLVAGNSASGAGGGIAVWGGSTHILASTISDNRAAGKGGGLLACNQAVLDVTGSTIARNVAPTDGGGIFVWFDAQADVKNSTISGNESFDSTVSWTDALGQRLPTVTSRNRPNGHPSLSADGRFVAFTSGNSNGGDVFVFDRQSDSVERVSVANDGTAANGQSHDPSISADGRFVAFWSDAGNLVPNDRNGWEDVFVYDRVEHTVELVSVANDGTQANRDSRNPSISADGRFVAFWSSASNLIAGDTTNGGVFVVDRKNASIERISVAADGTPGDGWSQDPSISADGRFVAFQSYAANLVPGDTNDEADVFVYDRQNHTIERVSLASDGTAGNGNSGSPSISADGAYVEFVSRASNLVPGDKNGLEDVFVYSRQTHTVERISVSSDGTEGNSYSGEYGARVGLSADGRFVAFESMASNLVPGDTNGNRDIFVFDRQERTIERTIADSGTQGNGSSDSASLSADGRFIAFASDASNLVYSDSNAQTDVFIYDRQDRDLESATIGDVHPIRLESVTVAENQSQYAVAGAVVTHNSLFVRNTAPDRLHPHVDLGPGTISMGFNVASSSGVPPSTSDRVVGNSNSWLGPLQDNGGPTWTHALQFGSPAADAGDPAQFPATDQRGIARPKEGDGLREADPDVGACESYYAGIRGTLYQDLDRDGERDANEPGLPDHFAYLDVNRDGNYAVGESLAQSTRDDPLTPAVVEQGLFSFQGLAPDHYFVAPVVPPGWSRTQTRIERVSVASDGTEAFGSSSGQDQASLKRPSLSADGRFVAFESEASNLVPGDTNGVSDVFVYDRQSRTIERVSVGTDGTQGNYRSRHPALSADGRFVAFASDATSLIPGMYMSGNLFVYDRQNRSLELVGESGSRTYAEYATISADGRFVAFESLSPDLLWSPDRLPLDTNNGPDVFVYDRQNRSLERVSVASDGTEGSCSTSECWNVGQSYVKDTPPAISADGRFVAFQSFWDNLVPGDSNGFIDVFVHDRQTHTTERVSVASDGTEGNYFSFGPSISGDGRYVAFRSFASNLVEDPNGLSTGIYIVDRQDGNVELAGWAGDFVSPYYYYDLLFSISADARFIAFTSATSNLVPGDTNAMRDVFIYDRQNQSFERMSVTHDGEQGNLDSYYPTLSADGRRVAFASSAWNLAARDTNGVSDVFVVVNSRAVAADAESVTLLAGQVLSHVDFGLLPDPGEIRGQCFQDLIANGVRDAGEPGQAGCTVYLDVNQNVRFDSGERSVVTDADGSYAFTNLPAEQAYRVGVVVPDRFSLVLPAVDANGVWNVFLPAGGLVNDRDFGLRAGQTGGQFENATLSGRVLQRSGGQGGVERGLEGVTLFLDLNDNGVRDFDEPQTLSANDDPHTSATDETGQYQFEKLGNRPYAVRLLESPFHLQTSPLGNSFAKRTYSLAVPGNPLGSPQDVAIGDFNGDGFPDLATALYDRNAICLLLNDAQGAFASTPFETSLEPQGYGPVAVLAGDFNGQGGVDLAVVNSLSSTVAVLLDFDGMRFTSLQYIVVGVLPQSVASGDLDGDGDLDLIVANEGDNNLSILRNDGHGVFTANAARLPVGNHPFAVVAGDFNEDHRLDLAVADFGTSPQGSDLGDVRVLLAGGNGSFLPAQVACPVGFGPAALVTADLNGDHYLDLAVANFLSDNVTVCRGRGDGTFTVAYTLPGGSGPMDIKAADLEGDEDLDLLVANGKSQQAGILRSRVSQGAFEFETGESFGVANIPGASQISLAVGDLDGNGTVDLALANSQENSVSVRMNTLVGGTYRVALTGTEVVNGLDFGLQLIDTTLKVSSCTPTGTGFVARFNWDLAAGVLNLVDQGGTLGPADVTVVGATVGEVRGSLVVGPGLRTVTFIKTGGVLVPDTYTVTLVSGAKAFRDPAGNLLDGNGDGTAGDDYRTNLTVSAPAANTITVSLPDFVRGYGQPVNLPANDSAAGIPLQLSDGLHVSRVQLTLHYDPSLLGVQAFALSSSLAAAGAQAHFSVVSPGTVTLSVTAPQTFATASGVLTVGSFTAAVPATAFYGAKHVLDIADLHVYDDGPVPAELSAVDDDAIHVAAFFGDASGSRGYNSPDVTLVQRVIGQLNTGFSAYQLADPLLLADITGNAKLQANDTVSLQRLIGQVPVGNVPALPTGITPPTASGADPTIYIPQNLAGSPGDTVTVPVKLLVTEPVGITLSGFDLVLEFDPGQLTVGSAQLGDLLADQGFQGLWTSPTPGVLIYTASSAAGTGILPQGSEGAVVNVAVTLATGAAAGPTRINLRTSFQTTVTGAFDNDLNELQLMPAPSNAADDSVDGLLTIQRVPSDRSPSQNPDQPLDVNNDGAVTALDVLILIDYINRGRPQDASVLYVESGLPVMYADVNGDRWVSAQDVLVVISHLNSRVATGGEAESPATAAWWPLENGEQDEELWGLLAEDRIHRQRLPLPGEVA
ncbi:MAG: S8 family serine peptidase [Planctomycetota bacterium]|nr:S8 family serine peptidase [Planctomycetota bacterium]